LTSFDSGAKPEAVQTVPIMKEGRAALEKINAEMGLGFDDFDLDYYTTLFKVSAPPMSIHFVSPKSVPSASTISNSSILTIFFSHRSRIRRKNSDVTQLMWSASTWVSRIPSILAIGFSGGKW
jgi:hypothetical protein